MLRRNSITKQRRVEYKVNAMTIAVRPKYTTVLRRVISATEQSTTTSLV